MKPVPKTAEFVKFIAAMRQLVSVPKAEILERERRAKQERKIKQVPVSMQE